MEIISVIISLFNFIIGAIVLIKFDQKIKRQTTKLNAQQLIINRYLLENLEADHDKLDISFSKRDNEIILKNKSLDNITINRIIFFDDSSDSVYGKFAGPPSAIKYEKKIPTLKPMDTFKFSAAHYPKKVNGLYELQIAWFNSDGVEHIETYSVI